MDETFKLLASVLQKDPNGPKFLENRNIFERSPLVKIILNGEDDSTHSIVIPDSLLACVSARHARNFFGRVNSQSSSQEPSLISINSDFSGVLATFRQWLQAGTFQRDHTPLSRLEFYTKAYGLFLFAKEWDMHGFRTRIMDEMRKELPGESSQWRADSVDLADRMTDLALDYEKKAGAELLAFERIGESWRSGLVNDVGKDNPWMSEAVELARQS